ncbi:MAG: AAA family ATPase, partial [Phaeodactylibacter sp.]|nr:AAA family ATPase [Phaeodactylibacter sp.]
YRNGGFTNLRLSTGQKKRLALTTCIIEDKPIYIFDEVAADLDPEFRDKYYYQIIRELRARNKTVIVVSHDRYYWTVPDRLLEMANGKMRELTRAEIDSLLKLNKPAGD